MVTWYAYYLVGGLNFRGGFRDYIPCIYQRFRYDRKSVLLRIRSYTYIPAGIHIVCNLRRIVDFQVREFLEGRKKFF